MKLLDTFQYEALKNTYRPPFKAVIPDRSNGYLQVEDADGKVVCQMFGGPAIIVTAAAISNLLNQAEVTNAKSDSDNPVVD